MSRQKIEKNFVDKNNRKWSVLITFTPIWYSHFPIIFVLCLSGQVGVRIFLNYHAPYGHQARIFGFVPKKFFLRRLRRVILLRGAFFTFDKACDFASMRVFTHISFGENHLLKFVKQFP